MKPATPLIAAPPRCLFRALALVLVSLSFAFSLYAQESRLRFDVPAGEAAQTLKQFATQAQREIVFAPDHVAGKTTNAVRGEFAPLDALEIMLADTGLVATQDAKSGALAVRRDALPNGPRAVQNEQVARPQDRSRVEDGALVLDKYVIESTRVDGLNNKGLLQSGPDAALYHDVMTRQDIERMGITSMEELLRNIPSTSSPRNFLQDADIGMNISGGLGARTSTMGLRGFSAAQTVILINGRALPRSGSGDSGGPDVSRIPLSAIERVEILPYAGSAIYGAGAIGGAINIILRKGYSGQEVTLYAGTSWDGGAAEQRVTVLDGRSFHDGRGRMTTTLSYQHRDPLRAGQRNYLARAAAKYHPGNRSILDGSGRTPFESFILPNYYGAPATIRLDNAPTAAVNDLGIPGASGVRWATIPVGTSPTASLTLTPASFASTAGQSIPPGQEPRNSRNVLYEPVDSYSANSQIEYDIFPEGRLSAYAELSYGYIRKNYSFPMVSVVQLAATDPLNPFRTNVTPGFVGRPISVFFDAPDLPEPTFIQESETARAVIGFKGNLTERFEWSIDGAVDQAELEYNSRNPTQNYMDLNRLTLAAQSAPAAVRRAVYPLLADHNQFPVANQVVEDYSFYERVGGTKTVQKEINARITGDLWDLPAGTVRASVHGKFRDWLYDTRFSGVTQSRAYYDLRYGVGGTPPPPTFLPADYFRDTWQVAAELVLPIISAKWRPIPVEGLEIQASMSRERSTTKQSTLTNVDTQSGDSSVVAAKLQLNKDVAIRASYSDAFSPPDWFQVLAPPNSFVIPFGALPDPARGNTRQGPGWNVLSGGNPNLEPEQASSTNVGLIITPRLFPKLTLNVDYWSIEKTNAVLTVGWPTAIANPQLYGFLITRAAATPAEQALGWAGVITEFDSRPINVARTRTEGFDLRARYLWETQSLGSFEFSANASFTNNFLLKVSPSADEINTAGGSGPVRWRGNGSVTWTKRPWIVTLGARYVGHFSTTTTDPSPSYPGAIPYDGGRIPAFMHYDLQVSYEVRTQAGVTGWRNWLAGTKWTVGANNVLNTKPDFMTGLAGLGGSGLPIGQSFYNIYDDPRQRFVYVSVNKSF